MGKLATVARRTFLIGSAAVIGGVAFGVYKVKQEAPPNPLLDRTCRKGATALTPYVRIDGEGVTLIAPRAEMGQGIHTTLAALVAEELDVAWDSIRVEHGPLGAAYYNARPGGITTSPFPTWITALRAKAMRRRDGRDGQAGAPCRSPAARLTWPTFSTGCVSPVPLRGLRWWPLLRRSFGLPAAQLKTDNGSVLRPRLPTLDLPGTGSGRSRN